MLTLFLVAQRTETKFGLECRTAAECYPIYPQHFIVSEFEQWGMDGYGKAQNETQKENKAEQKRRKKEKKKKKKNKLEQNHSNTCSVHAVRNFKHFLPIIKFKAYFMAVNVLFLS